jgi:hypothetical protein
MKAKPIIIIVITLSIGFVLGMLTSAQIRYHRLKPVRLFYSEERFRNGFYEVIKPDEKQKETLDKLLSKYALINSDIQNDFRKKMDTNMKDFWKELEPSLSKEQIARLKEMDKRRTEMIRGNRRNPNDSTDFRDNRRTGPPHEGRPPFHDRGQGRPRGEFRDSDRLKDNKEKVVK